MSVKDITDIQVLQAYVDAIATRSARRAAGRCFEYPEDLLAARTGQCEKVCWRAMERADRRGLLDWGVNLHGGWLTEKGEKLLEEANAKGLRSS